MQIAIEVPDEHIHGALLAPHSRYWARAAGWKPETLSGYVYEPNENGADTRHVLNEEKLRAGLALMAKENPSQFCALLAGDYDGVTGDVLLQFVALGEERYG